MQDGNSSGADLVRSRLAGRSVFGLGLRLLLLGLVLDEVHLRLAGLGRWRRRDDDVLRLLRLLVQHVDQRLLLVLGLHRDDRGLRGRRGRRLDEDDLVVLLGWRYRAHTRIVDLLLLWRRHVHVDVLLHDLRRRVVVVAGASA